MFRRGHGLFILPALMFGGWIAVAVLGSILGLAGALIGGLFRGLAALASGIFSGSGIAGGILIGLLVFLGLKKKSGKKRAEEENACTVDGETVETEIVEPVRYYHMSE